MKNRKIFIAIVIILIIFNCALLGFFWLKVYQKPQRPPMQGPAFEYLTQQLRLTKMQQQQYEKMRMAHRAVVDSLNEQSRMMRDSFFAKLKDTTAKTDEVNALGKRIAINTYKVDTSTFFHFQRFRKILTSAQQQKFDDIIQDVLRAGGRPPMPNGPGASPQGGQPNQQMPPQGPPPNGPRMRRPHPGQPSFGPPPDGRGPRQGMPPPPPGQGPPPGGPPPNGGPPPYGPPRGGPPPPGGPPQK